MFESHSPLHFFLSSKTYKHPHKNIRMGNIFTVISLILVAGLVAIELGITTAILELIVGIIAGNYLNFQSFETLNVLADFGLLALMYLAGLEIDTDILRKHIKSSTIVGVSSFTIPFIALYTLAYYILSYTHMQSALIATTLTATSVAIVYTVLTSDGKLNEKEKHILSSAMVVDVLGILAMTILLSSITTKTLIFFAVFIAFSLLVPQAGRKIFKYYKGNAAELEFKIILFIILGIGIASELAGIDAVLIAFMAGVVTSAFVVKHVELWDKLKSITFGFMAPIFFFMVGTTVSVNAIKNNIILILLFFTTAFIIKYVSTKSLAEKYMPDNPKFIGVLFNAPLSIGIVVTTLSFELGHFNQELYSIMISTVILSSIVATTLVKKPKYKTESQ